MLSWWIWVVLGSYGIAISFIFLYSLIQLQLLFNYRKVHRSVEVKPKPFGRSPKVLIQLPVFNEQYVVERLIDAAAKLNYPQADLEIQLLDDSTDESFDIATERVAFWKKYGVNIRQLKRTERSGFKAGALQYGLALSDAEFIVVFDADFIPNPDFLKSTLPYFSDKNVGMVQTRWGHLNRNFSLLTRVQAFALDAHFTIEQTGRNAGTHFINFNGTAGVWRRSCVIDAGGWSADTLTEDLDLSYRAQLKGWKFKYLEAVAVPAELPAEINGLKTQQYRWNKGAAECAVKHLSTVIGNKSLKPTTRIHAFFHLLNSSVFIWILISAVLSLPLVLIKVHHPELKPLYMAGSLLFLSFIILGVFYYTAYNRIAENHTKKFYFLWLYPAFLSISMGMSLHNSRAVLQGYFGKKTPFVRTPKWNIIAPGDAWNKKKHQHLPISSLAFLEGLLAVYFLIALVYEIYIGEWGFVLMHFILLFGFSFVFFSTVNRSIAK